MTFEEFQEHYISIADIADAAKTYYQLTWTIAGTLIAPPGYRHKHILLDRGLGSDPNLMPSLVGPNAVILD